jgi:glucose/arabinose dehydrogenase/mono/diheme cytochrome c family protein
MRIEKRLCILAFAFCAVFCNGVTQAQENVSSGEKTNAGLNLPTGFSARVVAENLGKARHIVVTPQNDIYVRLARVVDRKGTLVLHEANGKATVTSGFGNYGGTGLAIKDGYLYASSNSEVFRYKLNENNQVINPNEPEKIITGLIERGQHETKSLTLDNDGNVYVNIGAFSNSCQQRDRQAGSLGRQPCPVLDSAGGIWMFRSDKLNQSYAEGVRYATGLRNVVGLDWNQQLNQLFVMQHGRDQLHDIFPDLFTVKQSAELPAECMFALKKGDHAGWPYTYYDPIQNKKMIAPEYGGDGTKEAGNEYIDPVAAYPAHLAPNGLLFYTGNQFPERYKNGAFIAFHGSWNRSPEPQAGYFVVFQPFANGKPSGKWEVFAEGFSGSPEKTASGRAEHRPCGLAIGADGSLYVTDDGKGSIYKISYGNASTVDKTPEVAKTLDVSKTSTSSTAVTSKTTAKKTTAATTPSKTPAAGTQAKEGAKAAQQKPAPAMTSLSASIAEGKKVYTQYCVSCHQPDGGGVPNMNPPLTKTSWVLGNKSRLISVVLNGLSRQKIDGETYTNVMPGYNFLNDKQVADLLTFVRNSFGNKASAVTHAEVKATRGKK